MKLAILWALRTVIILFLGVCLYQGVMVLLFNSNNTNDYLALIGVLIMGLSALVIGCGILLAIVTVFVVFGVYLIQGDLDGLG